MLQFYIWIKHVCLFFRFSRAKTFVKNYFTERYLSDHHILDSDEQQKIMLKLIPDDSIFQFLFLHT